MSAGAKSGSELDALVAVEAQLDRRLAEARVRATELREAARRAAAHDELTLEAELAADHARILRDGEAAAAAAVAAIEEEARRAVARYEAVVGERLAAIAAILAGRVASEEAVR